MSHESQDWLGFDDVNSFLDSLKDSNELIEIEDQVSARFEISALLRELGDQTGPAALFTHVEGFPGHVVAGNLMGHRRRVARALGVQEDQLAATYLERK
jgi:4-hydroxy-3-polyprenylbenzoate decarboxylase